MNLIIRNNNIENKDLRIPKIIKNVKVLSISEDTPGISIEVPNTEQLFFDLEREGFKPTLRGRLIFLEVTGLSIYDD